MHSFPAFNKVTNARYGQLIYNQHDRYIGASIEKYGEFSSGEAALFSQLLKPGMVVVEAGANIGAHTVQLARLVGPQGAVFAFEPQRVVYQTLCGNLAINSITNVIAHHAAVGAGPGKLVVPNLDYGQPNNFGGLGLGSYQAGENVHVLTIDSLGLRACTLIKVDVEGMEEEVLKGSEQTIAAFKPLLYVECDREDKAKSLQVLIDSLGYRQYWHRPMLFNPNNFRGDSENIFGNIASSNLLCIHRDTPSEIQGLQQAEI